MKIRLRLIRARPNFYMVSDNPSVSLGIVDCSRYTRRIALKSDYHKKRMDVHAYTSVPSVTIDSFKDHYVLVLDLTSMQDATENVNTQHLLENQ